MFIVRIEWLIACIENGKVLPEREYGLHDGVMERKYCFRLSESIEQARKQKLLNGIKVYTTPKVSPDAETLGRMAEAAGGSVRLV